MKKLLITICGLFIFATQGTAFAVTADDLLPRPQSTIQNNPSSEIEALGNLPQVSAESAITSAIRFVLGIAMSLTIIALVATGIYYLTAEGDEEKVGKAKSILTYLIIGMAILAAAFGVVSGIAQLDFFAGSESTVQDETSEANTETN